MKLMIIRHAEPDYSIDSLTEKGWKEAAYLAQRMEKLDIKAFYVSPLGRAKDTASLTLKAMNRTARTLDWLREFPPKVHRPDQPDAEKPSWDWRPKDWVAYENFFDKDHWMEHPAFTEAHVGETYQAVIQGFDTLLSQHGYVRHGYLYDAVDANNDCIALFCHFGVECVLLSHLFNVSPMTLWHSTCAAPSSVTTLVTEERTPGIASFRMTAFGDISHLYANDEEPSFMARFRECHFNPERADD